MSTVSYGAFVAALGSKNERVIQLPHPRVTFLAQNHNGRAALLAKLTLDPNQIVPDGRGFSITTEQTGSEGFIRIASTDPGISLLFLKLVDYVLEQTAEARDATAASRLLVAAVNDFKRFFQRRPGRLGEEEIRGLISELLLLLHLQGGDHARTWDVFHAWGGPFGALHDFEFAAGNAIEVKSTHRPPAEIRISSPAQTAPLPDGLDLVVLPLERIAIGTGADVRFVDLVSEVGALAATHGGDVADLWDAALHVLGLDLADEYYEQWQFLLGDWLRFLVTENFPGIRATDIPAGVVKVTYSLRLDSLQAFAARFDDLEAMP
nr:PD-(D/E)XK motif protein [Microbacterium bovistercoris]